MNRIILVGINFPFVLQMFVYIFMIQLQGVKHFNVISLCRLEKKEYEGLYQYLFSSISPC